MSRREFSKAVKRAALERSQGRCEATHCNIALIGKHRHFDHVIPDALGGEPTLENCEVLCIFCHDEKTRKHDVPTIAKAKRVSDKHNGIRSSRQKIQSRGFQKTAPQRTASRPIERNR